MSYPIIPIPGFSEPFSCWSHFLAATLALIGGFVLVYRGRGNGARIFTLVFYTFCLVFLFSMSGVYHLLEPGFLPRLVLQRLDHAGIWTVIAGTFTPIHVLMFRGIWRWGVLTMIWVMGITGLVLETVFFTSLPEALTTSFYLGLGWMGLVTAYLCYKHYGWEPLKYLISGGLAYSVGALIELFRTFYLIPGIIGPHELFHIFVMVGAFLHWIMIYNHAHFPVSTKAIFIATQHSQHRWIARLQGDRVRVFAKNTADLETKILKRTQTHFHPSIRPKHVKIRYAREERVTVPILSSC